MMYSNNMAIAIKLHGKVLREVNKDQVYLPFGSEYTILIKNLSTKRAIVHVYTDGTDATGGGGLIIPAGKEVELERFINNGNLASGNRFKFIERTAGIENHRGIGIEDGLIRIEYQFEQVVYQQQLVNTWNSLPLWWDERYGSTATASPATGDVICGSTSGVQATTLCAHGGILRSLASPQNTTSSVAGITAPGSVSNQQFSVGEWFPLEAQKHVMILRLCGESTTGKVQAPITVKTKNKCSMCGRANKASAKFCSSCGTGLVLV